MEEQYDRDDFLAKWASGELTEDQRTTFEKSAGHTYYKAILEGTELLEVPPYDKDQLYQKIQRQKEKDGKVISLFPKWAYTAAAAAAVLFFGYIWLTGRTMEYTTGYGQQLSAQLPDNSKIMLNANSNLSFQKKDWENGDRTVNLSGEAFFEVEKGSDFTVETANGNVTVLGTEFKVNSTDDHFQVVCYEGRVKVTHEDISQILHQGDALRIHKGIVENWKSTALAPSWIQNESNFTNAPLSQVIKALENQFGLTIKAENVDTDARFTGSFGHEDRDTALQVVFAAMDINYTFVDEDTVVLVQQ